MVSFSASTATSTSFTETFTSFNGTRWLKSSYRLSDMFSGASYRVPNANVKSGFLQLSLPANSYDGGQIESLASYGYGSYSATMQCAQTTGAYCAFFSYASNGDEIDIEVWKDTKWRIDLLVYLRGVKTCQVIVRPAFDPSKGLHKYRFDYRSTRIRFFIDDVEQPITCRTRLPTSSMKVLFAAWRPRWMNGPKPSTTSIMFVDHVSYAQ